MSTALILQARVNSTRLRGKVLLPILGQSMLALQVERLRRARSVDKLIIATTTNRDDDAIIDLASRIDCATFRGSEADVLSRYYLCARDFGSDTIVRCNADCPLIDPAIVDLVVNTFNRERLNCDYVSNILKPSYPTGMHTEVFTFEALEHAHRSAHAPEEREHVTPFIYRHPATFRLKNVSMEPDLSSHRWTVDLPQDFEFVTRIFEALYARQPAFSMDDVLALLARQPELTRINYGIPKNATV